MAARVKVGIIGVMTLGALRATLIVNTRGLRAAPLAPAIAAEAGRLRADGVQLIIVASHARRELRHIRRPTGSSCDQSSEIFQIARERAIEAGG